MIRLVFHIHGEKVILESDSGELAEILTDFFGTAPECQQVHSGLDEMGRDTVTLPRIAMAVKPEHKKDLEAHLSSYLLAAVDQLARALNYRFLFLHACGFAFEEKGVLYCGPSGSGKTTLAMICQHWGFDVLGEDMVMIEWQTGKIYPLALHFRPRPFTRDLMSVWQADILDRHRSLGRPAPRTRSRVDNYPLKRLFMAGSAGSRIPFLWQNLFGRSSIKPARLFAQISAALAGCRVESVPVLDIDTRQSESDIKQGFYQWLQSEPAKYPNRLFKSA